MAIDYDKVHKLLHVAEMSLKFPELKPLHEAARKELHEVVKALAPAEPKEVDNGKIERHVI